MGAFGSPVQGGTLKYGFNGVGAVAPKPEPQTAAEGKIFPAFILPAVAFIEHALQFRVAGKGFLQNAFHGQGCGGKGFLKKGFCRLGCGGKSCGVIRE